MPRRLTHHPAADKVVGWAPDGKRILFNSARNAYTKVPRLYSVGVDGGFPEALPLPEASDGSFSPDGSRLAYMPIVVKDAAWKRYQGGTTPYIWIVDMADLKIERIPRGNSNDSNPMWVGDETGLRKQAWIEGNRRKVDEMSGASCPGIRSVGQLVAFFTKEF